MAGDDFFQPTLQIHAIYQLQSCDESEHNHQESCSLFASWISMELQRKIPYLPQHPHTHLHLYPHLFLFSHPHESTTFLPQALFYFHDGANFRSGAYSFRSNGSPASAFKTVQRACGSDQKAVKVNVDVTTSVGSGLCGALKWSREGWGPWTQVHTRVAPCNSVTLLSRCQEGARYKTNNKEKVRT